MAHATTTTAIDNKDKDKNKSADAIQKSKQPKNHHHADGHHEHEHERHGHGANAEVASLKDTLSFVVHSGWSTQLLFVGGTVAGIAHGLAWPMLAYFMSQTFQTLNGLSSGSGGAGAVAPQDPMADIRRISFVFVALGVYSLVTAFFQTFLFQLAAARASRGLQHDWFHALLLQDSSFWDTHTHVHGLATSITNHAMDYRSGMGAKLGELIQNATTGIAGIGLGLASSWQVSLLIMGVLPLVSAAAYMSMQLNRTKSIRAAHWYQQASSLAMTTLSNFRTVLSLNAIPSRVQAYQSATQQAMHSATSVLVSSGLWHGSMMSSIMVLFCLVVLFGSFVMYRDIESTGCNPGGSGGSVILDEEGNVIQEACPTTGAQVFAAMLGILFAGQSLSRLGHCWIGVQQARIAVAHALRVIRRVPESDTTKKHTSRATGDEERGIITTTPPRYYDPFDDTTGIIATPKSIRGTLEFRNVTFAYPSRASEPILNNFSLQLPAGKTIALVGPSGGGKSTVLALIERYYAVQQGQVLLDGIDIQRYNLRAYRRCIGYVSQEPCLFATTIRENICHGCHNDHDNNSMTQEQMERAATMANAHSFISSFPDGYDTHVGHKGAQLSGGEKQRIALSRILIANPSILLLDEATSALDSQSEQVVQAALDQIIVGKEQQRTTIVVAHRLSTIRNADIICVIAHGKVVEQGTHDELLAKEHGEYRRLVEAQEGAMVTAEPNTTTTTTALDIPEPPDGPLSSEFFVSKTMVPPSRPYPLPMSTSYNDPTPHINLRNVTFAYPARPTKTIFQNFNLAIMPGETVALVGPSGGGKSSVVALVERFYDPIDGVVEYKGVDITTLNVHWYRDQIGYVGQEASLFPGTIAENIALGAPDLSSPDAIEEAARQANAHDFIMSFPEGYQTQVGEMGNQISGGQKQRIAIARAMIKKPPVLILDESTSALDNQSEAIVQEALSKLMHSRNHTTLVIAHKLSTIRDADRIAYVSGGQVLEIGSHEELMSKKNGLYRSLVQTQRRGSSVENEEAAREETDTEGSNSNDEETETFQDTSVLGSTKSVEPEGKETDTTSIVQRIKQLAAPHTRYILSGSVGSLLQGTTYPFLGLVLASTIDLFFFTVQPCPKQAVDAALDSILMGHDACLDYWESASDAMQSRSFEVALYYFLLVVQSFVGGALCYWGFGQASERLTKRIRDDTFTALVRQEVGYFDTHNLGGVLSELETSTARLHAFAGTPIRQILEAATSVIAGILVSFVFMWPFALMSLACLVPMGFAARLSRKDYAGEDEGAKKSKSSTDPSSPGSILAETLVNIKMVAALTLEPKMFAAFNKAVLEGDKGIIQHCAVDGVKAGLGNMLQRFTNALLYFWGGYLLIHYPDTYEFRDFLVAQLTFIMGMLGLGAALQDLDDRQEVQKCAVRVFHILDRQSAIDSLSEEGMKLESARHGDSAGVEDGFLFEIEC